MGIPDEDVARVRAATDIVALIGEHAALKRQGQRWVGLCPFHTEKSPSFSVNAEEGFYYCFGCQESGDAITFVRAMDHLDFVDAVRFLADRAAGAREAGIPAERIVLDAGLDLGKTAEQSLTLLRASAALAGHGYPLLLSASNKTFLGRVLDLELTERREASIGAAALGISWGCRIVRVHDVRGTCRARDALAAISEAR